MDENKIENNEKTGEKKDERFSLDQSKKILIRYLANENYVIIPDNIEVIGDGAFQGKKITSVTIPDSVHTIGHYAFNRCKKLTSIDIPTGVIYIGDYAFKGCKNLIALEIPRSVKRIGKGACDSTVICIK